MTNFEAFARVCFECFGKYVNKWLTFNEINVLQFVPGISNKLLKEHNQMVAAARAVKAAHEISPDLKVGCMIAGMCSYPYTCDPADIWTNHKNFQTTFAYSADTMIFGAYPPFAARVQAEAGKTIEVSPEDAAVLMEGTVAAF